MLKNPAIRIFLEYYHDSQCSEEGAVPSSLFSAFLFDKGNVLRNQIIAAMQLAVLPFKGM